MPGTAETEQSKRPPTGSADNASGQRKIPWWVWLFVALSVLMFISFFLTFAIGITKGGLDG